MMLIMDSEDTSFFSWARWLKNTSFIYNRESLKKGLDFLYEELSGRLKQLSDKITFSPSYIIFVYRPEKIRNHPVSQYVGKAKELGFHFLYFEEYEEMLPMECDQRVFLEKENYEGFMQDTENGENIQEFYYPHVSIQQAKEAVMKLACVYVDERSLESSLTKNISLFEILGIMSVYDLHIKERWEKSRVYDSMAAPIGVKSGNEIVYLDINEQYHGPHGLVAGTTGSGKSEIMQTLILSLATLFHPYEVSFVIIDFKGGGMVNQFRRLPHLNGAITNIDGKEVNRSLLSIRAELRKRQEAFAQYEVNHIDDYIKLYKEGKTQIPLPHLILIVDEFAELKSDQPDFMKELISTARIGRSLGVHLILATQKPSGVVNDQIWSNSKFKLCLKVQNAADSNEVLKSPLASEIVEPGRAYLQVGNNEIFQLFQSAYSGAPVRNSSMDAKRKYKICSVGLDGTRKVIYEQKTEEYKGETQLEAIVEYIQEYCEKENIEKCSPLCLPPLEDSIAFDGGTLEDTVTDICVRFGIYDDPTRQYQGAMEMNLTQNNLMIVGTAQTGKTNLIQVFLRALIERYSPAKVNIYILDFASGILRNFEKSNMVGGVITAGEDEKVKNFFRMMTAMMKERKEFLAQKGLSSFSAYFEGNQCVYPQVIIVLEGLMIFRSMCEQFEDQLLQLIREGVSVGISVIATNAQATGIGYRMLGGFSKRIALNCNDTSEYATLFERCKLQISENAGRCIVSLDKEFYECQIYAAFQTEKELLRNEEIGKFILHYNEKYEEHVAAIPQIPAVVTADMIEEEMKLKDRKEYELALGYEYEEIKLLTMPLLTIPVLTIIGKEGFGRENYIRYAISSLANRCQEEMVEIFVLDSMMKKLEEVSKVYSEVHYECRQENFAGVISTVKEKIEKRYQYTKEHGKAKERERLLLLIVNDRDFIMNAEPAVIKNIQILTEQYLNMGFSLWLSGFENKNYGFSAPELVKKAKNSSAVILFNSVSEITFVDIPLSVAKENKKEIEPGEGFAIIGTKTYKIKTPLYRKTSHIPEK